MKKVISLLMTISIFISVNAMQRTGVCHNKRGCIVQCAVCGKAIDSNGRCLKFLRSLFGKMNALKCPQPDCICVFHPACLKEHFNKSGHGSAVIPSSASSLSQLLKECATSAACLCATLALAPVCVLVPLGIGSASFGVITFPAYYLGQKIVGDFFDLPFALGLMFGTNHFLNHNQSFGVGQGFATIACWTLGLGAYFIDAWAYSKWFCA